MMSDAAWLALLVVGLIALGLVIALVLRASDDRGGSSSGSASDAGDALGDLAESVSDLLDDD